MCTMLIVANRCFIHGWKQPLKERFNKTKIRMDSENENQLKRIRKPPLLFSQEESLGKKSNILSCLAKAKERTKKEMLFKHFPYPKASIFFHNLATYFLKFSKQK